MARLRANAVAGSISTAGGISAAATAFDSAGLADLPVVASPDVLPVTFYTADPTGRITAKEIVYVTAHTAAATTATISRAQEGTTAQVWALNTSWTHAATALDIISAARMQGAWSSGTAYSTNDLVTNAYGLYVALAAVTSGLGAPSTSPATAIVTGSVDNATGGNATGGTSLYQAFTTTAAGGTVRQITLNAQNNSATVSTAQIGIATAIGANPGSVTWLGSPVTANIPVVNGQFTVTLPAAVTLAASTQYYVAVVFVSGVGSNNITSTNVASTYAGFVASDPHSLGYSAGNATAWSTLANYSVPFSLSAGGDPYWQKLANLGADPANSLPDGTAIHYKGAWSSTATYSANDEVTNAYGLYAALAAVPSALGAPSTNPTYIPSGPGTLSRFGTTANGTFNNYSHAQSFVPTVSVTGITTIAVDYSAAAAGQQIVVGISNAAPSGSASPTYLSVSPVVTVPTGTATLTVTIPAVSLTSGTTYYLVLEGKAGGGDAGVSADTGPATNTNISNTGDSLYYMAAAGGTWAAGGQNRIQHFVFSNSTAFYWSKIANLGADPANVPRALAAYNPATAYAVGDEVSYLGDIFSSNAAQTGVAPSRVTTLQAPTVVQTSVVAGSNPTFSSAVTAGNSVLLVYFGGNALPSTPSGFTLVYDTGTDANTSRRMAYYLNTNPGAFTGLTLANSAAGYYQMFELSGTVQYSGGAYTGAQATTSSTITTPAYSGSALVIPIVSNGNNGTFTTPPGLTLVSTTGNPPNNVYRANITGAQTYTFTSTATYVTVGLALFQVSVTPSWSSVVGPYVPTVTPVTTTYTMVANDNVVLANGTFTVTLPAVASAKGRYTVKNTGTGTITIAPVSGTIDGLTNVTVATLASVDFVTDGINWFRV